MAKLLWEIKMGGRWIHNNIYIVPELSSIFYTDGTGCLMPAMKIRRLDIETGKEICTFPIRSRVNNLCFSSDHSFVFANTDTRIISMSSASLKESERWESQVPSGMTYSVLFDRILVMKGLNTGSSVNLYNLDTKSVKKIKVGTGGTILRDIYEGHLLSCCEFNVWRINAQTGDRTNLLSDLSFDGAAVDYTNRTLWLSRGSQEKLRPYGDCAIHGEEDSSPSTTRLFALPLEGKHEVQRFELQLNFQRISVSKLGDFIWAADDDYRNCSVAVLSVNEGLKVVDQFNSDEGERIGHIDAITGLVLTQKENFPDRSFTLKCWKL